MTLGESDAEPSTKAKKLCTTLQSDEKRVRKQALIDFEKLISEGGLTQGDHHELFKECHIHLLNTLRDPSEPVREQSIKLISLLIIETLPINDYYLSYLLPVVIERVGTVELVEESEEIRLQLTKLLHAVVLKYRGDGQLKPFLNDFVIILGQTVRDLYPAIKEISCKCIVDLACALPRDFHLQAETLVKPVLTVFGHQRYKIRVEAIKCIGEIVLHSSYKALEEVVGPMAERLFDQIPMVRRTVAQVAARWLLEYRDRYSFFHKLLPLILTGLNDEVPETRTEAHQLWLAVGLQYQNENEKDLKEQLDYLTQAPEHYPSHLTRPNLGCRVLVQRSVGKLTGALAKELVSWQPDVRVRCGQLLCAVAQHAEEGLTQHLQDLLCGMYTAARDDDNRVVVNIILASELMGVFVPVDTWKKLILPAIENGAHYGHLTVLASFIRGSPQPLIASSLREICQVLADPSICQSRKMKYQRELITCVEAVESKYESGLSDDIGQYLFNIIVTVLSIRDPENDSIDLKLLEALRKTLDLESNYALWSRCIAGLLDGIKKDPLSWTEVTVERCIFEVVLSNSGEAFGEHLEMIGEILSKALNTEVEPESRLKTFIALSTALQTKDVIFKHSDNLKPFLETIVTDVLVPSLVWHAGRTAEAMRTMAASCLVCALMPGDEINLFDDRGVLRTVFDRLLPLLLSLAEDASYRSRHLAMENLVFLKKNLELKADWGVDDLTKIYPEILKRLDDPTDKVRDCAIKSLTLILENPPEGFKRDTYKAHHEFLMDAMLTHFDDDDPDYQDLVKDALKAMLPISRDVVESKIAKHKPLLRNQQGCDEILSYITNGNS